MEVLATKKVNTQNGYVFKVQWTDSKEMAFIEFNKAKEKYPLIVLDYLVTRMRHRAVSGEEESNSVKRNSAAISDVRTEVTKAENAEQRHVSNFSQI